MKIQETRARQVQRLMEYALSSQTEEEAQRSLGSRIMGGLQNTYVGDALNYGKDVYNSMPSVKDSLKYYAGTSYENPSWGLTDYGKTPPKDISPVTDFKQNYNAARSFRKENPLSDPPDRDW